MNEKEFEFLGISKFHRAGYNGKGIKILSKELVHKSYFPSICFFNALGGKNKGHGDLVIDYLHQIAPEATLMAMKLRGSYATQEEQYIRQNIPDIMTCSEFNGRNDVSNNKMELWHFLNENNCLLCCAAGNENKDKVMLLGRTPEWLTIGACHYPLLKRVYYSNYGEDLDFMSLSNLRSTLDGQVKHQGTSFASPIFAGMLALVQEFFIKNAGKKLTNEQLISFVKDNCIDIEAKGKDLKSGYGLFVLPEPESINIDKYIN